MPKGYTLRKNGKRMKNIQFKFTIDEAAIQFIMDKEKVSFSKAEDMFKRLVLARFRDVPDWRVLAMNEWGDGVDLVHVEDLECIDEDKRVAFNDGEGMGLYFIS